jgi:hypothetical protein
MNRVEGRPTLEIRYYKDKAIRRFNEIIAEGKKKRNK